METEHKLQSMMESLEKAISGESIAMIGSILENINQLSDVGKLLLYLKLPTGRFLRSSLSTTERKNSSNHTIMNWLRTHLKENTDAFIPKTEIYEKYRIFAEQHQFPVAGISEFGKALKSIFPNVRDRRLGKRGDTKYVHSGVQYIDAVSVGRLPNIPRLPVSSSILPIKLPDAAYKSDQSPSVPCPDAGTVVLEWAEKLCDRPFASVTQLAEFLIHNHYVSTRSRHAFAVMTAAAVKSNDAMSGLLPPDVCSTTAPVNDTHALLRKNLQERKITNQMKDKMEDMRRVVRAQSEHIPVSTSLADRRTGLSAKTAANKYTSGAGILVSHHCLTPQKRILPKSASGLNAVCGEVGSVSKSAAVVETQTTAPLMTTVVPAAAAAPQTGFVLLSPTTTQMQSPMIVLPSPVRSSASISQVLTSSTTLPGNQTVLLLPTIEHTAPHLEPTKPATVPAAGSAVRNLSFVDGDSNVADRLLRTVRYADLLRRLQNVDGSGSDTMADRNTSSNLVSTSHHFVTNFQGSKIAALLKNDSSQNMVRSADTVLQAETVVNANNMPTKSVKCSPQRSLSTSSSKTVMSLLRENNGADRGVSTYLRDSRPVASILREERQKQKQQMMGADQVNRLCQQWLPGNGDDQHRETFTGTSIVKDSLVTKGSAIARRSSADRPYSVSDLLNLTTATSTPGSDVISQLPSVSSSSASARKRPHTSLNESRSLSDDLGIQGLDRLNVDLIERSVFEELLGFADTSTISPSVKNESSPSVKTTVFDSSLVSKREDLGIEFDLDVTEPPPAKLSLVNRSAENMTLQQLQQATSHRQLRDRSKQLHHGQTFPPMFSGRPVSTLGEPLSSLDSMLQRDSRPNTVAAFWEPTACQHGSSSVDSNDDQLPTLKSSDTFSHFTPIQNLSHDVPVACDLVRPMAKVPGFTDKSSSAFTTVSTAESEKTDSSSHRHKRQRRSQVSVIPSEANLLDRSLSGLRCGSPFSAEVMSIVSGDQRLQPGVDDLGQLVDESPSPYRSRSVPASVLLEFSLSDDFVAAIGNEDASFDVLNSVNSDAVCNAPQATTGSNDANFLGRPLRGDHLISGVPFQLPAHVDSSTVFMSPTESKDSDLVSHTPPCIKRSSMSSFGNVFEPAESELSSGSLITSLKLESVTGSDRLVEDLFNRTELLDWDCTT